MTLREQFRAVLRLLRLTIEGRNPQMSRSELFDRSLTRLAWFCGAVLVGSFAVALVVRAVS